MDESWGLFKKRWFKLLRKEKFVIHLSQGVGRVHDSPLQDKKGKYYEKGVEGYGLFGHLLADAGSGCVPSSPS